MGVYYYTYATSISIHALREEGDVSNAPALSSFARFLSTPSARRATDAYGAIRITLGISIHALREEGDHTARSHSFAQPISIHALREEGDIVRIGCPREEENFYPRPPRGGRRFPFVTLIDSIFISIHALREEGDSKNRDKSSIFKQIIQHSARI